MLTINIYILCEYTIYYVSKYYLFVEQFHATGSLVLTHLRNKLKKKYKKKPIIFLFQRINF